MGVTVALTGSAIAILYFGLNFWTSVEVRSPTSMLASALVHLPVNNELADLENEGDRVGRIRYRSDFGEDGWVKFGNVP
jgi:hypothetical protein